jgi:hypothetical protein
MSFVQPTPTDTGGKTKGIIKSVGSGDSFAYSRDLDGKFLVADDFLKAVRDSHGFDVSCKIDGQNTYIQDGVLYVRYDYRSRVAALFVDGTVAPLFQKFDSKVASALGKVKLLRKLDYPVSKASLDKVGIPYELILVNTGAIRDFVTAPLPGAPKFQFCHVSALPFIEGEITDSGFSEVIYVAAPQVGVVDLVVIIETGPQILRDVPVASVFGVIGFTGRRLTFEDTSAHIQGGVYTGCGVRPRVTTIVAHGIFVIPEEQHGISMDSLKADPATVAAKFYDFTLGYTYPYRSAPAVREGVVIVFRAEDGSVTGRFKINQGHLHTYAYAIGVTLCTEHSKQYLFM